MAIDSKKLNVKGKDATPLTTPLTIAAGAGFVGAGILKGVSNIVTGYSAISQATRVSASVITEVSLGATQTALKGEEITATKLGAYALGGLGAGLAGEAVAKSVLGSTAATVEREADHYLRIAENRIAEGASTGRISSALDRAEALLDSAFARADLGASISGGAIGASIETGADILDNVLSGSIQPSIGAIDKGIQGSANSVGIAQPSETYMSGGISNTATGK